MDQILCHKSTLLIIYKIIYFCMYISIFCYFPNVDLCKPFQHQCQHIHVQGIRVMSIHQQVNSEWYLGARSKNKDVSNDY